LFRRPFENQLGIPTARLPFPEPYRPAPELQSRGDLLGATLELVSEHLDADDSIGAILVEPVLGRGGIVIPPDGFLRGLREECDRRDLILIFDEVFTGFGRTGRWFACEHEGVVPDLLCIGKALSGMLPFSACVGRPEVMAAWPPSSGEAMHTSTFLGHPLACAAALAQIDEIESRGLVARSAQLGKTMLDQLREIRKRIPGIGDVRGRGLMAGIEFVRDDQSREPDRECAERLILDALRRGLILLGGGHAVQLSPPLTITEQQLLFALETMEDCLASA